MFQLDDLKKAKVVICTPELSARVIEGVKNSRCASDYGSQIVCLGEAEGLPNLFELVNDVNEQDAANPIRIEDPDKEKMMVFWSSGTTGKFFGLEWQLN